MPIDEYHKLESIGFEWTPKRGPRRRTNDSSSSSNRAATAAAAVSSSSLAVAPESTIEEEERRNEQEENVNRRSTTSTPVGVVPRQQQESSSPVTTACSIRGKDSEQPALPSPPSPPSCTTTTCDLNGVAGALLELQHGRVRSTVQSQLSPTLVCAAKEQQQQRAGGQVVRQLSDNDARGSTARQEATTTRLFDLAGLLDARQRSNQEQQHLCRLSGLGRRLEEPRQWKIPLDHQGSVLQLPPQLTSSVAQLRALQSRRNFVERALYQSRLGELQRLREQRLMVARCFANGNGRRDANLPMDAPKTNNDSSFQQQRHSKQPAESDEMIIPLCPPSMSCPSNNGSEEAADAAICAARDQGPCPPARGEQQPREPPSPPCAAAVADDDDEAAAEAAIDAARKMILGE